MRIIAGKYKGRRLSFVKSSEIRPTMDRVKESIFNVLGGRLQGGYALDLFAGCGSLGLEALSRGVAKTVFVDSHPRAQKILKQNIESLRISPESVEVMGHSWQSALQRLKHQKEQFDLVFMDPPYSRASLIGNVLLRLMDSGILKFSSRVIIEHGTTAELEEFVSESNIYLEKCLKFGGTKVSFFRYEQKE